MAGQCVSIAMFALVFAFAGVAAGVTGGPIWAAVVFGVAATLGAAAAAAMAAASYRFEDGEIRLQLGRRWLRRYPIEGMGCLTLSNDYRLSGFLSLRSRWPAGPPTKYSWRRWTIPRDDGDRILPLTEMVGTRRAGEWARVTGLPLAQVSARTGEVEQLD
jgi:hypothetical protein